MINVEEVHIAIINKNKYQIDLTVAVKEVFQKNASKVGNKLAEERKHSEV